MKNKKKIAIIGAGIFGCTLAIVLSKKFEVEIFEKRKSIKFAVNQVLVNENELISKADEVAFFPPMTGG